MIAFIDDQREAHGVEPICKVLPIAPSTYRAQDLRRREPKRLSARAKHGRIEGERAARLPEHIRLARALDVDS